MGWHLRPSLFWDYLYGWQYGMMLPGAENGIASVAHHIALHTDNHKTSLASNANPSIW